MLIVIYCSSECESRKYSAFRPDNFNGFWETNWTAGFYTNCYELSLFVADIWILRDLSLGQADINKVADLVAQHTAALKHAFSCKRAVCFTKLQVTSYKLQAPYTLIQFITVVPILS